MQQADVTKLSNDEHGSALEFVLKGLKTNRGLGDLPLIGGMMRDSRDDNFDFEIPEGTFGFDLDTPSDSLTINLDFLIKDNQYVHIHAQIGGLKAMDQSLQENTAGAYEGMDTESKSARLYSNMIVKSIDVKLEDQGGLQNYVQKMWGEMTDYDDDLAGCMEIKERLLPGTPDYCTAIIKTQHGREKTLHLEVKPEHPVVLGKLLELMDFQDPEALGALLKEMNVSVKN